MENSAPSCYDSIELAGQLGRLDFISAVLAALSLALILCGIFAFLNIRNKAKKQARKVALEVSRVTAEKVANEYIQEHLPQILDAYSQMRGAGSDIDEQMVMGIVAAQENGESDGR